MQNNHKKLRENQQDAVVLIKKLRKCILISDMGVGKTSVVMTAFSELQKENKARKALVLTTCNIVKNVWSVDGEVAEWSHLSHLKVVSCYGNQKRRAKIMNETHDIYSLSNDSLPWLFKEFSKKWKWDTLIVDESSCYKSSSSKRFRTIRKILPLFRNIILMTGTPSSNGLESLWTQIYMIDKGKRLYPTKTAFLREFFEIDIYKSTDRYKNYKAKRGASDRIANRIKDICVRFSLEGENKLPDPIIINRYIDMPPNVKKMYADFQKDFTLELENNNKMTAANGGVKITKMLQIGNGFVYTDNGGFEQLHLEKINCLKELRVENPNENLFVAYFFLRDKEMIREHFPEAVFFDESPDCLKRWNDGGIKMLCCHPLSAGHGINAQNGGSVVVWYSLMFSLESYLQLNARLHRTGQKNTVRIVHILARGGVDDRVVKILNEKNINQEKLLEKLKCSFLEHPGLK